MSQPDAERIRQALSRVPCERLDCLELLPVVGSTNSYLLEQPAPVAGHLRVALAERQTAGRGRLGRRWYSPPASGLYLSLAYTFRQTPQHLPGLTLAAGIAVATALAELGIDGVVLKWPNDLIAGERKLGGILTEGRPGNAASVVIGTGINIDLSAAPRQELQRETAGRIIDLASIVDSPPARARLAAAVVDKLYEALLRFESHGFASFEKRWQRYDWLFGREVSVATAKGVVSGTGGGIDTDGALLIRGKQGDRRIVSGSVAWPAWAAPGA